MTDTVPRQRAVSDLVRDLVRAVLGLVRSTARIFGFEARDVFRRLGRRIALLVASAVVAGAGLILVLGAATLLVEQTLRLPHWAGLALVGLVALAAGAAGVRAAVRRLGDADLAFPETVSELTKDIDAFTQTVERP